MAELPGGARIKDMPAAAGVSVGTVSNVLNRPHLVALPTRRRGVEDEVAAAGLVVMLAGSGGYAGCCGTRPT
jgi:LacI family transcriptional regulator